MQLGLSEPPQRAEMPSSRKRSCFVEPVFPKKLPRMERLVEGPGPLGLGKAISLSSTFQKEPIKYTEALFSYHVNGKEGMDVSPPRRFPKNGLSQIIHPFNVERQLPRDILYRTGNMAFPVEGSRISAPQEHLAESLFKPYKRNVQNCSPSALGHHAPTAPRKLTGGSSVSPRSRSPPGLVIPKPVYGHRPCCAKSAYASGPCYSVDRALPRINRSISGEEWMRQCGHIALLQRKAHEGLIEERICQLEQKGAAFPTKELNAELYCGTGSAENLRIPALLEPKFIAPYLLPSPSLLNYSAAQMSNLQSPPNVSYGKPPPLSRSINEVQKVAASNHGLLCKSNQDNHGQPVLSFPQENVHADTIATVKDVEGKCTEGILPNVKKGSFRKPIWQHEDPRFLFMDVSVPSSLAPHPFLRPFEQSPNRICKIYSSRGQQGSSLFPEESVRHLHGQQGDWPVYVRKAQVGSSPEHPCPSHSSSTIQRLQPYYDNEYMYRLALEKCNVLVKNRSDDNWSSKEALHHPTVGNHPKRTDHHMEKPEHAERASLFSSEAHACRNQKSSDGNKSSATKLSSVEDSENADSIHAVKTPKSDGEEKELLQQQGNELQASSSPPMPVINNVFSLAPCERYLEKPEKPQKAKAEVTEKIKIKSEGTHRRPKKLAAKKNDANVVTVSSYSATELCLKTEKHGGLACTDGLNCEGKDFATPGVVEDQVPQHKSSECSFLTLSLNSAPPPWSPAETTFPFQPVPPQYLKLSAFKNAPPNIFSVSDKDARLSAHRGTNDSKQAHRSFMTSHLSLCRCISSSVSCTKEQELTAWLTKGGMDPTQSVCPLLGASVREVWLRCQDTAAALRQVICQLENFVSCHQCPFPHVIRAGTIFIPMLVVKEVLFPDIPGELIDQVLQEHRVELRPTTLSEERHLMQLQKRTCSSKQRRLLSLRQLPDIYLDILNLFYLICVKERLGSTSPDGSRPNAHVSAKVSVGP